VKKRHPNHKTRAPTRLDENRQYVVYNWKIKKSIRIRKIRAKSSHTSQVILLNHDDYSSWCSRMRQAASRQARIKPRLMARADQASSGGPPSKLLAAQTTKRLGT